MDRLSPKEAALANRDDPVTRAGVPNSRPPAGGATAGVSAVSPAAGALDVLAGLVALSRPLFWMNSAALCVVAAILARPAPGGRALALVAFATLPLNLFVYGVNDFFDRDTDRRNPRKGSAEGALPGDEQLRALWPACAALHLPFLAWFAATASGPALAALLATYAAAWAYSAPPLRLKARPGWDSLSNAAYALPLVFASLDLGVDPVPWPEIAAFATWAVASHALTSIQDAAADRAAGVATIATRIGRARTARLAVVLDAGAATLVARRHPVVLVLLLAHGLLGLAVARSGDETAPHEAYRAFIALNLVSGFVLVTWIALAHPDRTRWAAAVMLSLCAVVAGALALARRSFGGR